MLELAPHWPIPSGPSTLHSKGLPPLLSCWLRLSIPLALRSASFKRLGPLCGLVLLAEHGDSCGFELWQCGCKQWEGDLILERRCKGLLGMGCYYQLAVLVVLAGGDVHQRKTARADAGAPACSKPQAAAFFWGGGVQVC